MKNLGARSIREDGGTASLEAALVLPFVLVLGVAMIEFGWLMAQVESVQTALRDAARHVSRSPLVLSNGNFSLPNAALTSANEVMNRSFSSNGIDTWTLDLALVPIANAQGQYLGGNQVYRIEARTAFTPASAGLLELTGISLPTLSLQYELRHAGG